MTATRTALDVCDEIRHEAHLAHRAGEAALGSGMTAPRLAGEFGRRLHVAQARAAAAWCRRQAELAAAKADDFAPLQPETSLTEWDRAAHRRTDTPLPVVPQVKLGWGAATRQGFDAAGWLVAAEHFDALAAYWQELPADEYADIDTWDHQHRFFSARGWAEIHTPRLDMMPAA